MSEIEISTGYKPRLEQHKIHSALKRFNVLMLHRRFGKTVLAINEIVDRGLRNILTNPRYAYIAPTYGQAKRVAWDYMKMYTRDIPGVTVNEAELRVDIPRPGTRDTIRFILLGAENPDSIKGVYFDGVVFDEYALMSPSIWGEVVRPALSDRHGWAIFISTPKGSNHFSDLFFTAKQKMKEKDSNWFALVRKASETKLIAQSELDDARATMTEEEYMQEYECDTSAALIGAYYGKYMASLESLGRITNVPYDPSCSVDTFWDLGINDSTVVWFIQKIGTAFHVIDYLEESGQGIEWFVKNLKNRNYNYENMYLPHDAAARELGTGRTRVELFESLWGNVSWHIVPKQKIEDGIQAVRIVLPKCWFDKEKCERGILALKSYEKKWDNKLMRFLDKPLHNWASHGADGFRVFATGNEYHREKMENKRLPRQCDNNWEVL